MEERVIEIFEESTLVLEDRDVILEKGEKYKLVPVVESTEETVPLTEEATEDDDDDITPESDKPEDLDKEESK